MSGQQFFEVNQTLEQFASLLNKDEVEEEPVDLKRFVTNQEFLGLPELSDIQYTIVDKMSQIYLEHTLINLYGKAEGRKKWNETVVECVVEVGKGSGKDFCLKISFARIIYLLHCLSDPLAYYGKGRGEYIDLLNIALNDAQARNVFFDPFKNLISESPWFQRAGFYPMSKEIKFEKKPIRALSGHSGAEGWEGYNLIAVVLDEIAAFKIESELSGAEKQRQSAKAIYDMARNSVISRFPSVGKLALLSFPRFKDDFIEARFEAVVGDKEIIKHSKKLSIVIDGKVFETKVSWEEPKVISYREPKVWAIKLPTHKVNPTKSLEDFAVEFIRDPIEARSRFLCEPPTAQQAYFRDPDRVRLCFPKLEDVAQERNPFDSEGRLNPWFRDKKEDSVYRWIHIDLGLKRDRAALCMVHCYGFKTIQTLEGIQQMPLVQMDLIHYWQADLDAEVDFNAVRQLALDLSTRFNVAQISIDHWNSEDTRKIFMSRGIYTEMETVDKKHYDTLSSCIYDQRLNAYYHPILLEKELLKLMLINGKKVDHPNAFWKDGSDCLAGATYFCTINSFPDMVINSLILNDEDVSSKISRKRKETVPPPPKELPSDLSDWLKGMKLI